MVRMLGKAIGVIGMRWISLVRWLEDPEGSVT